MLVRDEPLATIIQKGLEGFATDRFSSVVELQAYFEYQPEFPKNRKGKVHIQNVLNILNRLLYTGFFEFPDWGIPLMRGKHEPIISFQTYQKIQEKLQGRAKAPARKDLNQDFVLRGFVLCDGCDAPLRSCWSSGRHERYAYYLCHTKGCEHYGKSVRREIIEDSFDALLKDLSPTPAVVEIVEDMVVQARDIKFRNHFEILDNLKVEKQLVDRKLDQFLERIVQADSAALITAYERQVRQLEEQRIILEEKIRNCGTVDDSFDEINRTALEFIKNPHKRWASADLSGTRLVLKATFARPLAYHRKEGYRTAALSLPFLVLREFSAGKSNMVELRRVELLTSSMPWKRSTS